MGHQITIDVPNKDPKFAFSWMKSSPAQSSGLMPGKDKIQLVDGKQLWVKDLFMDRDNHVRVVFDGEASFTLGGVKYIWNEAYIYAPHVKGISAYFAAAAAASHPASPAGAKYFLQPAALFQQCNNKDWADDDSASSLRYGAVQCGLTSTAMLISAIWPWEKIKQLAGEAESGQFENWVAGQFKRLGAQSISMEGHVAVLAELGIKAAAYRDRSVSQLKEDLKHAPVVLGQEYKDAGHFTCAVGWCDNPTDVVTVPVPVGTIGNMVTSNAKITESGIIYNDPYGRRNYNGSGNNWDVIMKEVGQSDGLHNFLTTQQAHIFWASGSENSGWCVVPDRSVKCLGGQANVKPIVLPGPTDQVTQAPAAQTGAANAITITTDTFLKTSPVQSITLGAANKRLYKAGAVVPCQVIGASEGHGKIKLPDTTVWFVFAGHASGLTASAGTSALATSTVSAEYTAAEVAKAIKAVGYNGISSGEIDAITSAIMSECPKFGITTKQRLAIFIGECAVESANWQYFHELGDDDYFTDNYEGRDDLGNTQAGDGAKFPGAGWIMLTGRNWYQKLSDRLKMPEIMRNPGMVSEMPLACAASLFWWEQNDMNSLCDKGLSESAIVTCSRRINGGDNHRAERIEAVRTVARVLGIG